MDRKRPTRTNERYLTGDHLDINNCAQVEGITVHDISLKYIKSYNEKAAERGKMKYFKL